MSKLLVTAKHVHGPLENGVDGCHARWGNDGMCPGVQTAAWLNGLGEDDEKYAGLGLRNIDVRLNWLRNYDHIMPVDAVMESLKRREQLARRELRFVQRRICEIRRVTS